MDPSSEQATSSIEEDEWDTDGFVIPSLGIEDPDRNKIDSPKVEEDNKLSVQARRDESIYLGPHGAPPSNAKQQEQNTFNRKQRFKQKLKDADRRNSGAGRENKVDYLRELVGGEKTVASKSTTRDWLDPHCHESLFEKRNIH